MKNSNLCNLIMEDDKKSLISSKIDDERIKFIHEIKIETAFFNIPLLIFGDPISPAYYGKKIETLGSQADLAATLLHQLGLASDEFIFSKDLMSPTVKEFAFFSTIRGYGYISPAGSLRYNFDSKKIITKDLFNKSAFASAKKQSEACFYRFFKHFQNLDSN